MASSRSPHPLNIWWGLIFSSSALYAGLLTLNSFALSVTLRDGRTAFSHPPQLRAARVSPDRANARVATYRFSVTLPDNAGEPLQALELAQQDNLDTIRFNLDLARVETDDRTILPSEIALSPQSSGPDALRVVFDPPIEPGTNFDIVLKARRNPRRGGTYLFGIDAFPHGEASQSHFLGYGRLQFQDAGDRDRRLLF